MNSSEQDRSRLPGARQSSAGVNVKEALCRAAEEQFAAHGLEKATSHAIAERAGVHHAMVKYHFGSKEGLYEYVIYNISQRMTRYRLRRLDELERKAKGQPIPVKDLVSLYVEDFFHDFDDTNGDSSLYVRFHGWFLSQPNGVTKRIHLESGLEFRDRFLRAFSRTLPHLTERQLVYRIGSLIGMMIFWRNDVGLLESHAMTVEGSPTQPRIDADELVEAVIDLGCRLFA